MRNILLIVFTSGLSIPAVALSEEYAAPLRAISGASDFGSSTMLTQHLTHYVHEYSHYGLIQILYDNANATVLYTGEGPLAMPGALRFNDSRLSKIGDLLGKETSYGIVLAGGDAGNALLVTLTLYLNSMLKSKAVAFFAYGNAINFLGSVAHGYWTYLTNSGITTFGRSIKSDFDGIAATLGPTVAHLYLTTVAYAGVRALKHRAQFERTWLDRGVSVIVPWTIIRTVAAYCPSLKTVWGVKDTYSNAVIGELKSQNRTSPF